MVLHCLSLGLSVHPCQIVWVNFQSDFLVADIPGLDAVLENNKASSSGCTHTVTHRLHPQRLL
jgi:hypothetical protein